MGQELISVEPEAPTINIHIRPARGSDLNFIYSTWLDSYRYDSKLGKSHKNSIFFENYRHVIDHIFSKPDTTTTIACIKEDQNTILGYIVSEPKILHYIYTKGAFRRFGIAKSLAFEAFKDFTHLENISHTHETYTAAPILDKYPALIHNNLLLYKTHKENQ